MKKVLIEIPDEHVMLYEEYVQFVKKEKNEMVMPYNTKMFLAMIKILLDSEQKKDKVK